MTTDDELLDNLRRIAAEADPAPDFVVTAARAAFETRQLDDELAALLRDSDLAPSAVRGTGARLLTFETANLTLEVQVEQAEELVSVGGLVVGQVHAVEVQTTTTEPRVVATDEHGWFRVDDLPVEPFRIRVRTHEAGVTTGWIRP